MVEKTSFRVFSIVIGLLFGLLVTNCGEKKSEEQAPIEVKVRQVDTTTAVVNMDFPAVIQSKEVVQIRSKVTGYLEKIAVPEGGRVRKGQPIFKISDADFVQQVNAAKAAVESAQSNVSIARLEIEKLEPLVNKGIISAYELQTARDREAAAKAQLLQAKAQLENARINLGYTNITSPVDGMLGRISLREGSLVTAGNDELTTVSGFGDIWAYFSLNEKEVVIMRREVIEKDNGGKATDEITESHLILSDGTIYKHKGYLEMASGIIDRATGSIQMKVVFPNPDFQVLSGSSGVVRFPHVVPGAALIPQSATYEMQDKTMAYVVEPDNTVKGVSLTIGGITGKDYVVTNLAPGTTVVLEGADKMREGQKITPLQP